MKLLFVVLFACLAFSAACKTHEDCKAKKITPKCLKGKCVPVMLWKSDPANQKPITRQAKDVPKVNKGLVKVVTKTCEVQTEAQCNAATCPAVCHFVSKGDAAKKTACTAKCTQYCKTGKGGSAAPSKAKAPKPGKTGVKLDDPQDIIDKQKLAFIMACVAQCREAATGKKTTGRVPTDWWTQPTPTMRDQVISALPADLKTKINAKPAAWNPADKCGYKAGASQTQQAPVSPRKKTSQKVMKPPSGPPQKAQTPKPKPQKPQKPLKPLKPSGPSQKPQAPKPMPQKPLKPNTPAPKAGGGECEQACKPGGKTRNCSSDTRIFGAKAGKDKCLQLLKAKKAFCDKVVHCGTKP